MSKQRPDPEKMTNELAGSSAFFRKSPPATEPDATQEAAPLPKPVAATPIPQAATRTPDRPERPRRRQMIRHSFEVYMDQLERLREVANDQRERGELSSMSKMVRDAIDRLLADQRADDR